MLLTEKYPLRVYGAIALSLLLSTSALSAAAIDVKIVGNDTAETSHDIATIAVDLDAMLKASSGYSGSSASASVSPGRSLVEAFYSPSNRSWLRGILSTKYDYLIILPEIRYYEYLPEVTFDGVLQMSRMALNAGSTPLLLMPRGTTLPIGTVGGNSYRIANGCGIEVAPGGYAVDSQSGLSSPTTTRDTRRQAYLLAATLYTKITGLNAATSTTYIPTDDVGSALDVSTLAGKAVTAVNTHATTKHYTTSRHNSGAIRYRTITPPNNTVRYLFGGTSTEAGFNDKLSQIITASGHVSGANNPTNSQTFLPDTFNALKPNFDAYQNEYLITYWRLELSYPWTVQVQAQNVIDYNQSNIMPIAFDKHDQTKIAAGLRSVDQMLNCLYDGCEANLYTHKYYSWRVIPVHLASARLAFIDPNIIFSHDDQHMSGSHYNMMAAMMYTSALGKDPTPPEAVLANASDLKAFNLGVKTTKELAFLSETMAFTPESSLAIVPPAPLEKARWETFSHTFTATGGTAPYTWTESSATGLPAGLTLSPAGVLSGAVTSLPKAWQLVIKVTDSTGAMQKVPFALNVINGVGCLSATPTTPIALVMAPNGPFPATTTTYTLSNPGLTAINWTATKSNSWLTLSPASGTLAAGATVNVIVSINSAANSLAVGTHTDTIVFDNTTNGFGNTTRGVSLRVSATPALNTGADRSVTFNPSPWTPAVINPASWYDATDTATILQTSGAVSEWRSKIGTSHMLQAATIKQPITGTNQINGLNAISFDGTDDALKTATNPFGSTIQNALIMGAFNIGTISDSTLFSLTGSDGTRWQTHAPYSNGILYFDCAGSSPPNRLEITSGWSANTNKLLGFYCSTTDNVQQIWESGKLKKGDTSGHSVSTSSGIVFGHDGVSSYDNCAMGEVVIINGVVSNGNREALEGYLAHKWGFSATLPSTHPYKAAPLGVGSVVNVSGIASSDPDNDPLTYTWSVVGTSSDVMILDAKSKDTSLYFTAIGSYTLRLTVSDGYSQTSDDVVINVLQNEAPVVNAGANQTVALTDWTPEALNLMGWYDATDTATITQTGGAVSEWKSKKGTSHMVQATSTMRPLIATQQINGLNAIAFDGTDDGLKTATNPFGSSIQNAMFMGVINIGTLSPSTLYSLTGSDVARWQAHAPFSDGNIYYDVGGSSAANRAQVASGWSANQTKLLGFYCSTTDNVQQIWDAGTLKLGDTSGHSVNTNSGVALGYDGAGSYDNCKMGELVMINGVVSSENRQKIEGYLAKKWGMTSNLPSNHPYKTAPLKGVGVNLVGTASDANNEPLTYTWNLISGPLGSVILNSSSLNARLVTEVNGTYILSLTVSDGVLQTTDEVTVTVQNEAPIVNAGADQTIAMTDWVPTVLNPVAWYDATDASTISQSGGTVSEWRSKAGTSHMLQATSGKRPSTGIQQINGLNGIAFDGTDDALKTVTNPFGSTIQNAMFMAVTNLGTNTASTLFSLSGSSTDANRFQAHCPYSDGKVYFDTAGASGANRLQTTSTWGANQTKLLGFYGSVTANVQQVWNSGSLFLGDASGHSLSTNSGIALGNDGATNHDNCTMGEVVIINGVVTTENRQKLEGYLAHKWSLASTLPAIHPYKVAPPDYAAATLSGTASDGNNDSLTYQWSVVSGPPDHVIETANSLNAKLVTNVPGTYTMRLTVSDGVSQTTDDITIQAGNLTPYQIWVNGSFAQPFTLTGTLEDSDGDGAENLLEFAFGTDPTRSGVGPLAYLPEGDLTSPGAPILATAEGQTGVFNAVFARRKDHATAGITYSVLFSADLIQWTASVLGLNVVTNPNNSADMEAVSVPFPPSVPLGAGGASAPTFFRVSVKSN